MGRVDWVSKKVDTCVREGKRTVPCCRKRVGTAGWREWDEDRRSEVRVYEVTSDKLLRDITRGTRCRLPRVNSEQVRVLIRVEYA